MATLEQFANDYFSQGGQPTPEETAHATQAVAKLRSTYPGQNDDAIIQALQGGGASSQPVAPQNAAQGTPLPSQAVMEVTPVARPRVASNPTRGDQYRKSISDLNTTYGASAQQAAVDRGRSNNVLNDAARSANLGLRAMVNAAGGSTAALDDDYKVQTEKANRPVQDFINQRNAAMQQLENDLRAGDIDAADVKNRANKIGLEAAIREAQTKELFAAANANPQSTTSLGKKQLAKGMAPDLVSKINGFENFSGQQVDQLLPTIQKAYIEQLRNDGKNQAAQIKADAKGLPQPVKTSDMLRADKLVGDLSKQERGVTDKAEGAQETVKLFDRMKGLIDGGLMTGPIVGGDNIIGKTAAIFSGPRQEANQIGSQLVASMAKTFGAAPSDAEGRLIREANTILKQDNPLPALMELRAKFEREIANNQADAADIRNQKDTIRSRIGDGPMPSNTPKVAPTMKNGSLPSISSQADYDALPVGSTYTSGGKTYTKRS